MEKQPKPGGRRFVQKVSPLKTVDIVKERSLLIPVIGIGASADGLEALELFLKNVPPSSGMAFVIVQHLDPTHKGIMAELLQRSTRSCLFCAIRPVMIALCIKKVPSTVVLKKAT